MAPARTFLFLRLVFRGGGDGGGCCSTPVTNAPSLLTALRGSGHPRRTPVLLGPGAAGTGLCVSRPGERGRGGCSFQPDNFPDVVKGGGEGLLSVEEGCARDFSCCQKKCLRGGRRWQLCWLQPSFKDYKMKETGAEGR